MAVQNWTLSGVAQDLRILADALASLAHTADEYPLQVMEALEGDPIGTGYIGDLADALQSIHRVRNELADEIVRRVRAGQSY